MNQNAANVSAATARKFLQNPAPARGEEVGEIAHHEVPQPIATASGLLVAPSEPIRDRKVAPIPIGVTDPAPRRWTKFPWLTHSVPGTFADFEGRCQLASMAPGVSFSVGDPKTHHHPVSHSLRAHATLCALDAVVSAHNNPVGIRMVGGDWSMVRHHPIRDAVSCTRPMFSSRDLFRPGSPPHYCNCSVNESCDHCFVGENPVNVLMHSIYYVPFDTVVELARNGTLYAVTHLFNGPKGKIAEMSWEKDPVTNVVSMTDGSLDGYSHSSPDWLLSEKRAVRIDDAVTLVWNLTEISHGTYIVKFKVTDLDLPCDLSHNTQLLPYGIDTASFSKLDLTHVNGPYYNDVHGEVVHISLIAAMVGAASSVNPNDTNAYRTLSAKCIFHARNLKIPDNTYSVPATVMCATLIAAEHASRAVKTVSGTTVDVTAFARFITGLDPKYPGYFRICFNRMVNSPYFRYALPAAIFGGFWAYSTLTELANTAANWKPRLGLIRRMFEQIFLKTPNGLPLEVRAKTPGQLLQLRLEEFKKGEKDVPIRLPPGKTDYVIQPDVCVRDRELPPIRAGAHCGTTNADCSPGIGNVNLGIASANYIPRVMRSCPHNELAAIRARVTVPTTGYDGAFEIPDFDYAESCLYSVGVDPIYLPDTESWLESLPRPKRTLYEKGRDSHLGDDELTTECFVKRENAVLAHEDVLANETLYAKPRAIQSSSPAVNFHLGAWFSAYTKQMEYWTNEVVAGNRTFAYTMTPPDLARRVEDVTDGQGWHYMSLDFSAADASVSSEVYKLIAKDLHFIGMDQDKIEFFERSTQVNGKSRSGIEYASNYGLASGRPYTTATHSRAAAAAWDFVAVGRTDVHLFHKSDDNLICYLDSGEQTIQQFIEFLRKIGYAVTYTVTDHLPSAEFLSLRFWPGQPMTATPKIGRTLSKLFYSAYPSTIGDPMGHCRQVAIGMRALSAVPVFGAILRKILELTENHGKSSKYNDEYAHCFDYDSQRSWDSYLDDFCIMYTTSREEIEELEKQISAIDHIPYLLDNPLFDRIIARDLNLDPIPTRTGDDNGDGSKSGLPVETNFCGISFTVNPPPNPEKVPLQELGAAPPPPPLNNRPLFNAWLAAFIVRAHRDRHESAINKLADTFVDFWRSASRLTAEGLEILKRDFIAVCRDRVENGININSLASNLVSLIYACPIAEETAYHTTANKFGTAASLFLELCWAIFEGFVNTSLTPGASLKQLMRTQILSHAIMRLLITTHSLTYKAISGSATPLWHKIGYHMLWNCSAVSRAMPMEGLLSRKLSLDSFGANLLVAAFKYYTSFNTNNANALCLGDKFKFSTALSLVKHSALRAGILLSVLWTLSMIPKSESMATPISLLLEAWSKLSKALRPSPSQPGCQRATGTCTCSTCRSATTPTSLTVSFTRLVSDAMDGLLRIPQALRVAAASQPSPQPPGTSGTQEPQPPSTSRKDLNSPRASPPDATASSDRAMKLSTRLQKFTNKDRSPPTNDPPKPSQPSSESLVEAKPSTNTPTSSQPESRTLQKQQSTQTPKRGQQKKESTRSAPSTTSTAPSPKPSPTEPSPPSTTPTTAQATSTESAPSRLTRRRSASTLSTSRAASSEVSRSKLPSRLQSATSSSASQRTTPQTSSSSADQAPPTTPSPSNSTLDASNTSQAQSWSKKIHSANGLVRFCKLSENTPPQWVACSQESDPSSETPLEPSLQRLETHSTNRNPPKRSQAMRDPLPLFARQHKLLTGQQDSHQATSPSERSTQLLFENYDNNLLGSDLVLIDATPVQMTGFLESYYGCECPLVEVFSNSTASSHWCCHSCTQYGPSLQLVNLVSGTTLCPYASWAVEELPRLVPDVDFQYAGPIDETYCPPVPTEPERTDQIQSTYSPLVGYQPHSPRYNWIGPLANTSHLLVAPNHIAQLTSSVSSLDIEGHHNLQHTQET